MNELYRSAPPMLYVPASDDTREREGETRNERGGEEIRQERGRGKPGTREGERRSGRREGEGRSGPREG